MPPTGSLFVLAPANIQFSTSFKVGTSCSALTVQPFLLYVAVSVLITFTFASSLSLLTAYLVSKSLFSSAFASRCARCTRCQPPTDVTAQLPDRQPLCTSFTCSICKVIRKQPLRTSFTCSIHKAIGRQPLHIYRVTSATRSSIRNSQSRRRSTAPRRSSRRTPGQS